MFWYTAPATNRRLLMTVATQLLLCGISLGLLLTTEAHLETDSEAGLHDLTHRFIGEVSSNGCEQKGPQDLKQDSRVLRKTPVGCSGSCTPWLLMWDTFQGSLEVPATLVPLQGSGS